MPSELRPVLESAEMQVEQHGAHRVVRLPITLRGETLGVMSFSLPGSRPLSDASLRQRVFLPVAWRSRSKTSG